MPASMTIIEALAIRAEQRDRDPRLMSEPTRSIVLQAFDMVRAVSDRAKARFTQEDMND